MSLCPTLRSLIGMREKRTEPRVSPMSSMTNSVSEFSIRETIEHDRREKARNEKRRERHQKRELEDRKQYSYALSLDDDENS